MNFLAHAWLSHGDEMVMAANVSGDSYKGSIPEELPHAFRAGLALHRFIDQYTDSHVELSGLKELLKPYYKRYAGVALDVWLDHVLARNFESHHPEDLEAFSVKVYNALSNNNQHLNNTARQVAHYMSRGKWLSQYRNPAYIPDVLHRMSLRFRAGDLSQNGHPGETLIHRVELKFNELSEELQFKTGQKLKELLAV